MLGLGLFASLTPRIQSGDLQPYFDSKYRSGAVTVSDFDTIGDWTKVDGEDLINDTINYVQGNQSLKWNTTAGTMTRHDRTISLNSLDHYFTIWFYVYTDPATTIDWMTFYCFTSNVSQYFHYSIVGTYTHLKVGWNKWTLSRADFTVEGNAPISDWNDVNKVRILLKGVAGQIATVSYDDWQMLPDVWNSGRVTFRFDDVFDDFYTTVFPNMTAHGFKGCGAAVTTHVGTAGRCTWPQLREMQAAGWDITSHSRTHAAFEGLSENELISEIQGSQNDLLAQDIELGSRFLIYPGSSWNQTVLTYMRKWFSMAGGRTAFLEHFAPSNELILFCNGAINTTTVSTMKSWIDEAKNYNGWLIIYFHHIKTPADETYSNTIADFNEVLDYIETEGLPVMTLSDVFDEFTGLSNAPVKFYSSTANLTAISYEPLKLTLTLSATGTSTSRIWCGDEGEPITVTGATSWSYNSSTKICTVTISHSSSKQVVLDWYPPFFSIVDLVTSMMPFLPIIVIPVVFGFVIVAIFKGGGKEIIYVMSLLIVLVAGLILLMHFTSLVRHFV